MPATSSTADRVPTALVEATEQDSNRTARDEKPATMASESKPSLHSAFRVKTIEGDQRSVTPIKQVAAVAAEVADTAAKLDGVSFFCLLTSKGLS